MTPQQSFDLLLPDVPTPQFVGSSPEVSVDFEGHTHVTKWWTLGRVAHESALVMPDLTTIYTTDDGSNCGLYMFKVRGFMIISLLIAHYSPAL